MGVWRRFAVVVICLVASDKSIANERRFAYTYESLVLPYGAMEIELWTTPRLMRDHYFVRFDQRLEHEVGLGKDVQSAFYLNALGQAETSDIGLVKKSEFRGVSWEWKWKVSDPSANWIGSALYGEVTFMPHELELEAKVILDRWLGPVLLAYNLVGEFELEAESDKGADLEWERVGFVENVLGVSYQVHSRCGIGLEVLNRNRFAENRLDYSAILLGPTLSASAGRWWVVLTFLAQLPSLRNSEGSPHKSLVLDDLERYQARLLLGYHL